MKRLHRRTLLAATLGWGSGAAWAQPAGPGAAASAPSCGYCRERWQTVDALRTQLPSDWQLALEPEPVLGAEWLVLRAGAQSAPPLLLVHGLGQNGLTDWLPVIPALARTHRVLAVDLPGFGYSPSPTAKLSPTNLARVLAAWLARENLRGLVVAGHSMGGAVTLRLAEQAPERLASLVLMDVAGILQRTAFTKHLLAAQLPVQGLPGVLQDPAARLRDLGHILVERMFGLGPDPTDALRRNEWLWPLALRDRTTINAALALVDEDFGALLPRLALPVHVIWGEQDAVTPLRTGELLSRRLPRAQLWTLPGVGHDPMAQAPGELRALLQRVLQQPPQPRVPAVGAAPSAEDEGDLVLRGDVGRRVTGRYRDVQIDRCTSLRLSNLDARRIVVRDSIVQMTGVRVQGGDIALDVARSEVEATACDLSGGTAVRADEARLDLAGVTLAATAFAVQVVGRSRLVASVSQIRDALNSGPWHDDRTLERELLGPRAAPRPTGT